MKPHEFHVWDFPAERIRVLFKNHQKFLDETIAFFGSRKKLASFLAISLQMIYSWKKYNLFIPLTHIKKIVELRRIDWDIIEKNVLAYKGPNLSLVVKNPKLPIKESPELFAIIAHLIGDGSVNRNGIPMYINSSKPLIENFDALIREVFGDIDAKLYQREDGCYNYTTSKVIADLFYSFYSGINFDSLTAQFPAHILQMPKTYLAAIIRAITDDEGHIGDCSVAIRMKNKTIIDQIKEMLIYLFGTDSVYNVRPSDLGMYEVDVRSEYLTIFQKKIRLVHPNKQCDLAQSIQRIQYRKKRHNDVPWYTKIRILRLLAKEPQIIKSLTQQLLITNFNIGVHLRDLQRKYLITRRISCNKYIYTITSKGTSFLHTHDFSNVKRKINIDTLSYNKMVNRSQRIKLADNTRKRVFWFLRLLYGSETNIGNVLNVYHGTINNWKTGRSVIPAKVLNRVLILLSENGVNITQEINQNIREIRTINGRYTIQEE